MTFRITRILTIAIAAALAIACNAQSTTDSKVAELEQRLAETEKQLAEARQTGSATPAAPAAEAQNAQPATAPLATEPPHVAAPLPAAPAATPTAGTSRPSTTATREQAEREKAELQRLIDEQKGINASQSATNTRLRQDVERLTPREYMLAQGTVVPVRTTSELSTARLANGSTFDGLLESDLKVGETVVAAKGSRVTCVVVSSDPGGRVKGTASLGVTARSIVGVKGAVIAVKSDTYSVDAESTKTKDAVRTGIATGVGAIIGGIAGGGSGAAKGAGAGAAAGVGVDLATRGAAATIPAETLIQFHLLAPATVVLQP
jgi:hypothetical protein